MNVLSPFDETVRDLSLAQHLPRIKKLLVYVCTRHWENDPAGLASYHLHELIQQLTLIAPTFEKLKAHLNSMIQTLNKPGEYTLVANTILRNLQRLYPDAVTHVSPQYQSLYRVAAKQLALDEDQMRIKKLLYFVCRGHWTSDLDQVVLLELVAELHELTPTYQELSTIFDSVVQNVSKPQKYQAIAQRIINGLAPLYHPATHAVIAPTPTPAIPEVPHATVLQQNSGQPVANPLDQTVANLGAGQPTRCHRLHAPITPAAPVQPPAPPAAAKQPAPISMRKRVATLTMDDWFTMRIEIHKFTNPLLAKYLLFMHSYADAVGNTHNSKPGQWDRMTWDALKNTDLDTLLRDGLKSCRNIGEFERSLKRTIRKLNTPNQYKPVISAILRSVHPLFAHCTGKETMVQRVSSPPSDLPTHAEQRSPSSHSSQPLPHIPHYQKDSDEKHTLLENHEYSPHLSAAAEPSELQIEPQSEPQPVVVPIGLEHTEGDSQFENTEAEVTEQSQSHIPYKQSAPDETAFLLEQEVEPKQQNNTASLVAQPKSTAHEAAPHEANLEEAIGIPTPLASPGNPFDPFGTKAEADNPADETIAMPMH
ncbi:MAG: hypothetical protein F6K30_20285 [Cyanothece sp. SIO2G6]|nr:hypothetical protein [Cyanothece sp. SIO2G6]